MILHLILPPVDKAFIRCEDEVVELCDRSTSRPSLLNIDADLRFKADVKVTAHDVLVRVNGFIIRIYNACIDL